MKVIKSNTAEYFENSTSCTGYSYGDTGGIDGARVKVNGRYPEKGYFVNEVCKELVHVISGSGDIVSPKIREHFTSGDTISVDKGEPFAWEGAFDSFIVCSPAFYPEQHKEVAE